VLTNIEQKVIRTSCGPKQELITYSKGLKSRSSNNQGILLGYWPSPGGGAVLPSFFIWKTYFAHPESLEKGQSQVAGPKQPATQVLLAV
jgi:hypothetical protein